MKSYLDEEVLSPLLQHFLTIKAMVVEQIYNYPHINAVPATP